jgi:hypothetical protein
VLNLNVTFLCEDASLYLSKDLEKKTCPPPPPQRVHLHIYSLKKIDLQKRKNHYESTTGLAIKTVQNVGKKENYNSSKINN